MEKVKFTTTIDKDLLSMIKIEAIKESRSVSAILTEIIEKYLKEKGVE